MGQGWVRVRGFNETRPGLAHDGVLTLTLTLLDGVLTLTLTLLDGVLTLTLTLTLMAS